MSTFRSKSDEGETDNGSSKLSYFMELLLAFMICLNFLLDYNSASEVAKKIDLQDTELAVSSLRIAHGSFSETLLSMKDELESAHRNIKELELQVIRLGEKNPEQEIETQSYPSSDSDLGFGSNSNTDMNVVPTRYMEQERTDTVRKRPGEKRKLEK